MSTGRPPYVPTDEHRRIVKAMAGYGVPQEDIGKVVGCSHPTLRKNYGPELETAAIEANAKVAETCFKMAVSGEVPAATFFWLKTRARWRETQPEGDDKSAVRVIVTGGLSRGD